MWIDSHCHLNHEKLQELGDINDILTQAASSKVEAMLTICCRITEEFPQILDIAQNNPHIWCTIGTHPHNAGDIAEQNVSKEELIRLANSDSNIIGIGETGLDYHYNYASIEDQQKSLHKHLQACIDTDLPVIIHAREADEDLARILAEESAGGKLRGVMHCFSSGRALAEKALELGFYISFSGIITFKGAEELREIARDIPLERVLIETDAPYLAPVPYRGQTNQPAYVSETGRFLASLYKLPEEDFAKQCRENFFQLFKKAAV